MKNSEYKLMAEVQNKHWWWLGRNKIIEAVIKNQIDFSREKELSIADVGCGYGTNIPMLRKYGNVTALELNDETISELKKKFGGQINIIKWKSPEKIDRKFDLILLADVLEHILNDREAILWIYNHLNSGGYALLTVPAHQFFWSQMDEVVHHYRRYSRKEFLNLFNKFFIKKFSFYNFFLFPVKVAFVIFARLIRIFFLTAKNDLIMIYRRN